MFEVIKVIALKFPMTMFLLTLSVVSGTAYVITGRPGLDLIFGITLVLGIIGYLLALVVMDD